MSSKRKQSVKAKDNKNKNYIVAIIAVILAVIAVYSVVNNYQKQQVSSLEPGNSTVTEQKGETTAIPTDIDVKILKSEVGETAKFYPYKAGETYMEVLAVKATDGSIRTALNTCQICFDSGRGYYKQEGNTLVCQNCGNVFGVDDVEVVRGGCNPVPVMEENKTDDGEYITVKKEFMEANKDLFAEWKR